METHEISQEERDRAVVFAMTSRQVGTPQTCGVCGRDYAMTAGELYRPSAVCVECWPEKRARARIAEMTLRQVGTPQTCAFCGRDYAMTHDEPYRPEAVCTECWPEVSALEQKKVDTAWEVTLKGLSPRTQNALIQAGYVEKENIAKAIASGRLRPGNTRNCRSYTAAKKGEPRVVGLAGVGEKSFAKLCEWCGAEEPPRVQNIKKPVSQESIQKAISLLKRNGYVVTRET